MVLKKLNEQLSEVPILIRFGVVLSACIIFLSSGYLYWKNNIKEPEFRELDEVTNVLGESISTEDLIYIPGQIAHFDVDPNPMRVKTYIRLQYLKPMLPSSVTLHLGMNEGNESFDNLLFHPVFDHLSWISIQDENYSLFQKQQQYESIDDFLENLPQDKQIIYDSTVNDDRITSLSNAKELELEDTATSISGSDFLITTYHEPSVNNGFYVYEKTINTTQAKLTSNSKMKFELYNNNISEENPFYMKEIFIDFKQPAQIIYETQ